MRLPRIKNEIIRYGLDILNHIGAAICIGVNLLPHSR